MKLTDLKADTLGSSPTRSLNKLRDLKLVTFRISTSEKITELTVGRK